MLPLTGFLLLLYCLWRGGHPLGVAILAVGVMIHFVLTLRLVKATAGGVGGHAEFVRDVETRPRMQRSQLRLDLARRPDVVTVDERHQFAAR